MLEQLDMFSAARAPQPVPDPASSPELWEFKDLFPSHIHVKLSARLKSGWYIQFSSRKKNCQLTVPAILELSPPAVKKSLLNWAMLMQQPKRKWSKTHRTQRKTWEGEVRAFLENPELSGLNMYSLSQSQKDILLRWKKKPKGKLRKLNPVGVAHDLRDIFQEINKNFFNSELAVKITWSPKIGGLSTHSLQKDPEGNSYHLITISQGYNAKNVSREILGGVVYHECLHAALPPKVVNGRRVVHGADFKKRERQYPYYAQWIHWHKTQLSKNLRTLRWKKSMGLWRDKIFKIG